MPTLHRVSPNAKKLPVRLYKDGVMFSETKGITSVVIYNAAPFHDGYTVDVWVGEIQDLSTLNKLPTVWQKKYKQVMCVEWWGNVFDVTGVINSDTERYLKVVRQIRKCLTENKRTPILPTKVELSPAKMLEASFYAETKIKVRITPRSASRNYARFNDAFPNKSFNYDVAVRQFYILDLVRFGLKKSEIEIFHPTEKRWLSYADFDTRGSYGIVPLKYFKL